MNKKTNTTDRKRSTLTRIGLLATPALAAATLLSGIAATGPASAAPAAPAPAATATQDVSKDNLKNSTTGSLFYAYNRTAEYMRLSGRLITPHSDTVFHGRSSDNDFSGKLEFADKTSVDIHANNPTIREAYFQVGPHKVYDEAYVNYKGKCIHVKFVKNQYIDDSYWKMWDVNILGDQHYYTHEFIHHRDMVDGVKGTVTNKTDKTATVRVGGADLDLKPGQRLLYFDAGLHSGDKGTQITVLRTDKSKGAFTVEAVDPSIGYPKATVVDADGKKESHHYSAKESKSYTESGSDFKLTVTRQADHKLPCIYENAETSDWAVFDIDITAK